MEYPYYARNYDGRRHSGWTPSSTGGYDSDGGLSRGRHHHPNRHVAFKAEEEEIIRSNSSNNNNNNSVLPRENVVVYEDPMINAPKRSVDDEADAYIKHEHNRIQLARLSNESEVIQNVVQRVFHILNTKGSFDTDGLLGLSSKVQDVFTMLEKYKSKGVVSIGICGKGGSGKTDLASVIFEHIKYEFEITYFVSDVWRNRDWKGPELGRIKLKERPWRKKVLIVLGDVDYPEILHALCGDREWFGEGSRIIITTRDVHLLISSKVDLIYRMKHLNHHESLELFSRTAFKQANPKEEFIELSCRMVDYTQ